MSDSLQPHGLQHARPPCPSPTPGAYSNSVHWVSEAIQPFHPLSSLSPLALNLSQHQGLFQGVHSSHQVAKVLEFSFSISPSNEYSGLISFRMDWFDLLTVLRTLKSLLQRHGSKASILQSSASFMVQLSHPYMTTGKTIGRSNQSILKETSPGCSLEGLMLRLKLQYFGHLMRRVDSLEKTLKLAKTEGRSRRGWQRIRLFYILTDSMEMSLSKLQELA